MNFEELIRKRFSCRKFKAEVPRDELLKKVVHFAHLATSAKNIQPWKFIIVRDEKLTDLKNTYKKSWIQDAPAIIVACANYKEAWIREDGKNHADIDVSIAADHLTLAATELGLGTCWVCKFDVIQCATILNLPEGIAPIAMFPIGFPAVEPDENRHDKLRKNLDEVVTFEKYE